jgi:hypothetical protein
MSANDRKSMSGASHRTATPVAPLAPIAAVVSDDLDDGRQLVVEWSGEHFGWGAYVPGDAKAATLAATPLGANGPLLRPAEHAAMGEGCVRHSHA